jgi:hypothetical protein
MKYANETVVNAKYINPQGNPFLEAMPELMGKYEFVNRMKSDIRLPYDLVNMKPQERRSYLTELTKWFLPMDYMYSIYDMLYQAIATTYQTKTTIESIRQVNKIYTDFRTGRERTLSYATQAYSGAILGVPGIGKTSTIQRCLNSMPQVIIHKEYQTETYYTKQINHLVVECPSDCSIKTLAFNIISAIDRAIGSDYIRNGNVLKSISSSALMAKLKIVCMNHHIGLIVIDEIQNAIMTATRNKQIKPLIKFLVELTNETTTSICFCGTLEAEELFQKKEHLKRRTRGLRLLPMKYDAIYRKFIKSLWEHQITLQKAILTEKLMKQIYDLSGGIPAYIIKIFMEAQTQAVLSGKEKISYEVIKQAVAVLGIDVPKVYMHGGTSISDFTVQEIMMEEIGYAEDIEASVIDIDCRVIKELEAETLEVTSTEKAEQQEECVPEPATEPVKRFYASKRGRKRADRDKTDLLAIWIQNEDIKYLVQTLETCQMIERRRY